MDNAKKMESVGDAAAMYYEIAGEAIAILEKNSVANGGKMVIRDDS